ncbi:polysaccharide deacetylase family protein [Mucisphaera sp.]|uniref:polysaccharide deacetylase family protein n=1 Tax=Mucisphaera sp. TaxID=2913024 RepID=UPI003D0E992E
MPPFPNNRRAAISLTYDDGVPAHNQHVGPELAARGFHATFYANTDSDLIVNPDAWRSLAHAGHELGNHTVLHPCRRSDELTNAEWLDITRDLKHFSLKRFDEEIRIANAVLKLIDGRDHRSYGNTCHNTTVGQPGEEISIEPVVKKLCSSARGDLTQKIIDPTTADLHNLGCFRADSRTLEDLKPEIDQTLQQSGWIIYCIHGVGPDAHPLHIDAHEHEKLLNHLTTLQPDLWVAPVHDVATHIAQHVKKS